MKARQLLMLFMFFAMAFSAKLTIDSTCNNYLKKFGTAN